ncbi:MAG: 50S ribosomal protein L29 [Chitinispirillales bacterium]|jgi:large subunit ribosomal protein L29|nr:50S ribosomal protein L29 [Chitinispirillales bacterium]
MKAKEVREMLAEDLVKKIDSLEEEFFNLRFQAKMGQLTNPLQLRYVKRDIARVKTILNEKQKSAAAKA